MITVANRRTTRPDGDRVVYVGRPSALGNPFRIGRDGTREEVIGLYESWLYQECGSDDSPQRAAFDELLRKGKAGDLTLVCHCAPLPCHGDVLARWLREALATICQHEGCVNPGQPCFLPDDGDEASMYYCWEHMHTNGFCPGCSQFWGGVEDFEFDPHGYCSNCRDNPDVTGAEPDDDDDWPRDYPEDLP